jgi:hypothetical protein
MELFENRNRKLKYNDSDKIKQQYYGLLRIINKNMQIIVDKQDDLDYIISNHKSIMTLILEIKQSIYIK